MKMKMKKGVKVLFLDLLARLILGAIFVLALVGLVREMRR